MITETQFILPITTDLFSDVPPYVFIIIQTKIIKAVVNLLFYHFFIIL